MFFLPVHMEKVMKSLLGAVLLAAVILPATANATTMAPNAASKQNVYRTVSTTLIENDDGSTTVITVHTSYYIFGVR